MTRRRRANTNYNSFTLKNQVAISSRVITTYESVFTNTRGTYLLRIPGTSLLSRPTRCRANFFRRKEITRSAYVLDARIFTNSHRSTAWCVKLSRNRLSHIFTFHERRSRTNRVERNYTLTEKISFNRLSEHHLGSTFVLSYSAHHSKLGI